MKTVERKAGRRIRHMRLRRRIIGTSERPRLCVMVSNKHLYVQLVDDEKGVTLSAATSCGKSAAGGKTVAGAKALGQKIAELAKARGIATVIFDRGGYQYHGRVKAVAEGAREAGLKF